jgi:signal transduction histidine kinase
MQLRIRDDGRGFPDGAPTNGFGLRSIESRARRLGGGVEIESTPSGTTVEVTF